jgi:uncharacterized protein with PQ loop repeat
MEVIGWVGTALVVVAYYPQIHHLFVERCAWGISVLTWLIWLIASVLLLTYCVLRQEVLLCFVQGVNILAIATTLILVRRSDQICPFHRKVDGPTTRK